MPGGGKKAVFPTLALHDHETVRVTANEQDRAKKALQSRGSLRKSESKESPDKEKCSSPQTRNKASPKTDYPPK